MVSFIKQGELMKLTLLALVAAFGIAQAYSTTPAAVDCKKPENAAKAECVKAAPAAAAPAAPTTAPAPVKAKAPAAPAPVKQ